MSEEPVLTGKRIIDDVSEVKNQFNINNLDPWDALTSLVQDPVA